MDGKAGTWILYAILAVIAFFVIKWVLTAVLHMLFTVLQFAIIAAVVIAIVGKRRRGGRGHRGEGSGERELVHLVSPRRFKCGRNV